MELIDVCDEHGNVTGEKETIDKLHKNGKWHRIVAVVIYDDNKNLLMQQRSLTEKSDPGIWDIAAAGHVASGETSKEAIIRETFEEVGILLKENQIELFTSYNKETKNEKVNRKHIEDIFIAKIHNIYINELKIQKEEVEQVKLLSINEVKELIHNKKVKTRLPLYDKLFEYLKNTN